MTGGVISRVAYCLFLVDSKVLARFNLFLVISNRIILIRCRHQVNKGRTFLSELPNKVF